MQRSIPGRQVQVQLCHRRGCPPWVHRRSLPSPGRLARLLEGAAVGRLLHLDYGENRATPGRITHSRFNRARVIGARERHRSQAESPFSSDPHALAESEAVGNQRVRFPTHLDLEAAIYVKFHGGCYTRGRRPLGLGFDAYNGHARAASSGTRGFPPIPVCGRTFSSTKPVALVAKC